MLFLTRLKVLLRTRGILFWTLAFPFLLVTAEYMAFGNLTKANPLGSIDIVIVNSGNYAVDENMISEFDDIYTDGEKLFNITYTDGLDNSDANILIYNKNGIKIATAEKTITLDVIKNVFDTIYTYDETATLLAAKAIENNQDPNLLNYEQIFSELRLDSSHVTDISSNKDATWATIYFYSAISMLCMYGNFYGVQIIEDIRADKSNIGIRISITPFNKFKLMLSYFLAALLVQYLSSIVVYLYLSKVLGIIFTTKIGLIYLLLFVADICGISLGMFIRSLTKSDSLANGLSVIVSLALSFLGGTMSVQVKHLVDVNIPFLANINPANLITDGFYTLYYYSDNVMYFEKIKYLLIISLVFLGISIMKIRGERYDSI